MPELPNDASIDEVAEVFGVADRVEELTPAARQLTKGKMIALLGATNTQEALRTVVEGRRPSGERWGHAAREAGVDLKVQDVKSVEEVFDSNFSEAEKDAMRAALHSHGDRVAGEEALSSSIIIYACCCPCCCATTVLSPTQVP